MQQSTLDDQFRAAVAEHQAGKLPQAEQIYRQILSANPNHAGAWHLLGVLAQQVGRSDAAVQMISRAIQLGLRDDAFNNLGEALRTLGRHKEAIAAYQNAIQHNPNNAEAHSNLGLALNNLGKYSEARPILEKAISLKPNLPNAHFNYGITLDNLNKLDDAIEQWEITLRLMPTHPLALNNLGVGLQRCDRNERSVATLRKLTDLHPNYAEGHANLGAALAAAGKHDEALVEAKKAVEMEPNRPEAHNTLGVVHTKAGRYEEALAATKRAVELNPRFHKAVGNVGGIYQKMERQAEAAEWFERAAAILPGDVETANALYGAYYKCGHVDRSLASTERAIQYNPHSPELHGNRSLALLALGRYIEGFEEYEWRWRCGSFTSPPRDFDRPMWENTDPAGRTILVHSEQGFGDIIQFMRYVPMLAALGAKIIVEVPVGVRALVESMPGVSRVVPKGLKLPDFDMHIPLLSLPRAFKTTVETIPADVPYFNIDPARMEKWRQIVRPEEPGLRVGIVWGGNLKPDPKRSVPLKLLESLLATQGVRWFGLQTGDPRKEMDELPREIQIIDLGKDLKDFADTAAIVTQLDLVVTIDTAMAHLCGAMAVKTWTMVPSAADWRWFMEGESSPWYPTMRLFRQMGDDRWEPVIERVRGELEKLVVEKKPA